MQSDPLLKNVMFISSIAKNKWGGVEKWMFEVGKDLHDKGYKVIYCGRADSKFIEMSNINSFKNYSVKFTSDFNPFVSYKLRKIATNEKIDLICVGREKDLRLLSLAYLVGKRPTIIMRKGLALIKDRWRFKIVYEYFVDLIITPSSALRDHLLDLLPWLESDKIQVINNGVALPGNIEKGLFRKKFYISEKIFLAVIIGRLSDQKGQKQFIRALSLVKDRLKNTMVLIIGDGEQENNLRNEVKNLDLSEIVKFVGHQWDIPNILTDSDLLVHPSLFEGMPNLVLEALAHGTPVLATDIPGVDEIAKGQLKVMELVPPNNLKALADKFLELRSDLSRRESLAAQGKDHVEKKFSLEKMLKKSEEAFIEMYNQRSSARKKVIFLTQMEREGGSTRYRALQWVEYLNNKGWKAEWIFARHIRFRKFISILKKVRSTKIVHIQKKLFSRPFLFLIKSLNQNIIYDFDDALYTRDSFSKTPSSIGNGSRKTVRRLKYVLKSAKIVIAGNDHLAEYAAQFNNEVRVVPTTVKFSDYENQRTANEGTFTIGWIGQSNNQVYLKELKNVFSAITVRSPKVILKVISDKPFEIKGVNIINIKWDVNDYKNHIYEMDIGIMPLKDDEWSRGKCAFKLIQYMAAGVPVIASDVGANSSVVTDGNDGYLVKSDEEWIDKLTTLIDSANLRVKMGKAARLKIKENYSVEVWGERVERIYLDRLS